MPGRIASTLLLSFLPLFFVSCQVGGSQPPVTIDGKTYGRTEGAFLGKWYDYYERGLSFMEGELWPQAERDLRAAIAIDGEDDRRNRTYGLHFDHYFPNRELGVVLFRQNRYQEAARSLEASLSTEQTAKAQYFLDQCRKAIIEQNGSDRSDPILSIQSPEDPTLTNAFEITVKGTATDDTLVKSIRVNGEIYRIDLAKQSVEFELDVPVISGKNFLVAEVEDIVGNRTRLEIQVACDRTGPTVSIESFSIDSQRGYQINGAVHDNSGIRELTVDGKPYSPSLQTEFNFSQEITNVPSMKSITISATDQAGNVTTAELAVPPESSIGQQRGGALKESSKIYLASLEMDFLSRNPYYRLLASNATDVSRHDQSQRGRPSFRLDDLPNNPLGNYAALIIGIDNYEYWRRLETAVNDAKAMEEILIRKYGFLKDNIKIILNEEVTEEKFWRNLIEVGSSLGSSDNLLVYFAGHGYLKKETNEGFWIPVDGELNSDSSWIAHSRIKNLIRGETIKGKNVIFIVDSCYGGSLSRSEDPPFIESGFQHQKNLVQWASQESRQIITSGSLKEEVADWGRNGHSLFAYYLLKAMEENAEPIMDLKTLFHTRVFEPVKTKGGQRPMVSRFRESVMEDDGEFVLVQPSRLSDELKSYLGEFVPERIPMDKRKFSSPPVDDKAVLDKTLPVLEIKGGIDDRKTYLDRAFIEFEARDNKGIVEISINGRNILDSSGKHIFVTSALRLSVGSNSFLIECSDRAGNRTQTRLNIEQEEEVIFQSKYRTSLVVLPFKKPGEKISRLEYQLLAKFDDQDRLNLDQARKIDFVSLAQKNYTDKAWANFAHRLGVDTILLGDFQQINSGIELFGRIIDAESAEMITFNDVWNPGDATPISISKLCEGLTLKLLDKLPIEKGVVVGYEPENDTWIVDIGKKRGIKKNMKLIIYREGKPLLHPATNEVLKEAKIFPIAEAKIVATESNIAYAKIRRKLGAKGEIEPLNSVITQ